MRKHVVSYDLASLIFRRLEKRGRKLSSGRYRSKARFGGCALSSNGYTSKISKKQNKARIEKGLVSERNAFNIIPIAVF